MRFYVLIWRNLAVWTPGLLGILSLHILSQAGNFSGRLGSYVMFGRRGEGPWSDIEPVWYWTCLAQDVKQFVADIYKFL